MKRILLITIWVLLAQIGFSQIPAGYYDTATGAGYTLKTQLHNIIDDHTVRSYDNLWTDMQSTDKKTNGYVWDMYSDVPGGSPAYDYTFGTDQCGNYSGEGSCYNREHSFPKSWFNDASPMYTDLFHLVPTDGYVNGKRSNYPFGEVGSASWTSTNGSKLGTSNYSGYSGTVFEPIDEYKGDFARGYFYMATRYEDVISAWPGSDMLNGSSDQCFSDWALNMLIEWHNNDPVSQKEIDRNNAIHDIQNNRNPFIDHPEYVAKIWGSSGVYITNINQSPASPTSSDVVTITADITSSGGTITTASLKWGTSTGVYGDPVSMTSSGDTYSGNIPVQLDGITVYYVVEAEDNNMETATSTEYSYVINDNPTTTIFFEDFETVTLDQVVDINGWTTYQEAGTRTWEGREFESNKYAQMTAYQSEESSNITWIITPQINLSEITEATLSFKSKDAYNNGEPVELFISTNYSGNPTTAMWTKLTATFATGSDGGYADNFTESGDIDLSSYCGDQMHLGYKYVGGDPSLTTTMQIDDVLIIGTSGPATNQLPQISNIQKDPTSPTESEDVTISATITDSDGSISSAKVKWGTVSETYDQESTMTATGNDYSGIISAQAVGTTIYFVIEATDNDAGKTTSTENSVSFIAETNEAPQITNIQKDPTSPTESEDVTISATITDSDGSISSAKVKWGTVSETYDQESTMSATGNDYSGIISAQAAGTTIYFVIEATDNDAGKTTSIENSVSFTSETNELPQITSVDYNPKNPESTQDVTVSATITDSDGTISTIRIQYGTSAGNYTNEASMTGSGTYTGTIPAQIDGTTVYFIIEATDNESGVTVSTESNYTVEDSENVSPEIVNVSISPASPTSVDNVIVSCEATDADGSIAIVLLRWKKGTDGYTDVNMTLTGNKYYGQIPAQNEGETVNFIIVAEDNKGLQASYNGSYQVSESTGMDDLSLGAIVIYPNPTRGQLTFETSSSGFISSIILYNLIGEKIREINNLDEIRYTIDIGNLPKGMYIVKVNEKENSIVKRIILR